MIIQVIQLFIAFLLEAFWALLIGAMIFLSHSVAVNVIGLILMVLTFCFIAVIFQ